MDEATLPAGNAGPEARISDEEFRSLSNLVHKGFGIHLTPDKKTMVQGRLQRILRERGGMALGDFLREAESDGTGALMSELINRISTNHTFFNREKEHFDFFRRTALPEAEARARRAGSLDVRVWCAASSTGEEPYMLAMLLREHFGAAFAGWEIGLLATDISEQALATAKAGVYAAERAAELPPDLLKKHFNRRADGSYAASEALRRLITYRRFNLVNPEFPFRRPFDAIFCRNVMIYFDGPTKDALVRKMARFAQPGSYLFIGHSETLGRDSGPWQYVRPAVYRRKESP